MATSLVNWRPRLDRIDEVVVPESALAEGANPRDLPEYISYLVKNTLWSAACIFARSCRARR
jgi:hypothetical protein